MNMKNGLIQWDRQEMPEEEIEGRIAVVQKRMVDEQLDALIIFCDVTEAGAISYFSNFAPFSSNAALILSGSGNGILVGRNKREQHWRKANSLAEDVRASLNPANECSRVLKELVLNNKRVGIVEWNLFPYLALLDLKASSPQVEFVDATNMVDELRLIKSPIEIRLIEKAARIADQALEQTVSEWEYEKECELAAQIQRRARYLGCEDVITFIATNKEKDLWLHPPTEKPLGIEILVEVILQYKHYWAAVGRTIVRENVDKEFVRLKEIGERAYVEAIQNLKEGQSIQNIFNTIGKTINNDEIKILANASFGLGMQIMDRVWMREDQHKKYSNLVLRENMKVILQLGLVDKATSHRFLVQDSYLIGKQKSLNLTNSPFILKYRLG